MDSQLGGKSYSDYLQLEEREHNELSFKMHVK